MSEKFPITFWNYNRINDYDPETEVAMWSDCGITVGTVPRISILNATEDQINKVIAYLDAGEKYGVKMLVWVDEVEFYRYTNAEEYTKIFNMAYEKFKHPALYGFYAGDEPRGKVTLENCRAVLMLQKQLAPELVPYINFGVAMADAPLDHYGGKTFDQWLYDLAVESGFSSFCFGHYDQMTDEKGVESYFNNMHQLADIAEKAGVNFWNTQLSSAHYMFRVPSFYDLMWQITTAVACGSKGISWFRLYDRWHSPTNYHGSPIDEYGNPSETYNRFLRANRLFQDEYGELFLKLKRKATYFTHKGYGGYTTFPHGAHPVIKTVRSTENGMVSFFEDADGNEYLVLVNATFTNPGVYRPEFDRSQYKLIYIRKNDADINVVEHHCEYTIGKTEDHWDGVWLYPGQLNIFRIEKR